MMFPMKKKMDALPTEANEPGEMSKCPKCGYEGAATEFEPGAQPAAGPAPEAGPNPLADLMRASRG